MLRRLTEAGEELRTASDELDDALVRTARAEAAVVAAEALADTILGLVEQAVVVLDADLRVVGWSPGAERLWSRPADQTVGSKWSRVKRSVDDSVAAGHLDALMATDPPGSVVLGSLVVRTLSVDGEVRYIVLSPAEPT